jgi:tRNA-dihydrouridine synthase
MIDKQHFEATKTLEFISTFLGIDLTERSRKRCFVEGRMMYAKLMKRHTKMSLTDIGRMINIDHATIIHYLKNFQYIKKSDQSFSDKFDTLSEMYEEFRESWFDDEKYDDKKKIRMLEMSLSSLTEKKEKYERYFKKIERIDSIVQLIEQRTPKGEEDYVESKINRMFNSIIFNP